MDKNAHQITQGLAAASTQREFFRDLPHVSSLENRKEFLFQYKFKFRTETCLLPLGTSFFKFDMSE